MLCFMAVTYLHKVLYSFDTSQFHSKLSETVLWLEDCSNIFNKEGLLGTFQD